MRLSLRSLAITAAILWEGRCSVIVGRGGTDQDAVPEGEGETALATTAS